LVCESIARGLSGKNLRMGENGEEKRAEEEKKGTLKKD